MTREFLVKTKEKQRGYPMSNLAKFLKKLSSDVLGEALREITFVGEGIGCYENFDVRPDATQWTPEKIRSFVEQEFNHLDGVDFVVKVAEGYTFNEGDLIIDVFWYWDGDGILEFCVKKGQEVLRAVINTDCKTDYCWEDKD